MPAVILHAEDVIVDQRQNSHSDEVRSLVKEMHSLKQVENMILDNDKLND